MSTGNWRVDRILVVARKYGHAVEKSEHTDDCWIIRKQGQTWGDPSITVYAAPHHGAHVMYDPGSGRDWLTITQREAMRRLAN